MKEHEHENVFRKILEISNEGENQQTEDDFISSTSEVTGVPQETILKILEKEKQKSFLWKKVKIISTAVGFAVISVGFYLSYDHRLSENLKSSVLPTHEEREGDKNEQDLMVKALKHYSLDEYGPALTDFIALSKLKKNKTIWDHIAKSYYKLGAYEDSLTWWLKSEKEYGIDPSYWIARCYMNLNNYEKSVYYFNKKITKEPLKSAGEYYHAGKMYFHLGDLAFSKKYFEKIPCSSSGSQETIADFMVSLS